MLLEASTSSQQQPGEAPLYPYLDVPGVRFVPTDQELILCYLRSKLRGDPPPTSLVRDDDVYAEHPEYLTTRLGPSVEDYWYVFTQRSRKYAKGGRPSRSTGDTGRWKSVGKNTPVTYGKEKATIGFRNSLAYEVFVRDDGGDSKKKRIEKTEWKMTEFVDVDSNRPVSSGSNFMLLNDWVLCRITRKPEKKKGEEEDPGASPADEVVEEEEHEPSSMMLADEPLTDTSPDTSQQAQVTAPAGLLGNGANWSDSTADSQAGRSGSGSDPQKTADDDPFESLDLGPLPSGNSRDHVFTIDPWAWNLYYPEGTDIDSSGSRLRTPSDPDPMEIPSEPPAYHPQPRHVVTDLPSSSAGGLDELTKVIRKRKEHARASGDDAGKKGNAAVKKSSGRAKPDGQN
ncbi:NAC domain-containing protein 2-like [Triticum urartu]|uniref:NAC domain-containing protein 2-like n=1 Tax=Triticum urartu TaxID=4572 RepID=UPI0020443BEC|nr:NAC domain-containing protein 2-like [Triticum urartu]